MDKTVTSLSELNIPPKCHACPIRHRAVCAYCEAEEFGLLERIKFYRDFEPGQEIAGAGEAVDFVGSVVTGVVKLTKGMADGRQQMVGLLFPSDFLGRPMNARLDYDAAAVTKVALCMFRRAPFEALMRRVPRLQQRLLEMTLSELDAAREWLLLLGRKTAEEKLASFLTILVRRSQLRESSEPDSGSADLELPMTRSDIAECLGLTIETVSRQFARFKKSGLIELRGPRNVHVPDVESMSALAGDY